jgi:hypothetical protein
MPTLRASKNPRKTALLILGFNRPEFVRERLEECSFISEYGIQIICSIDGLPTGHLSSQQNDYRDIAEEFDGVEWLFEQENLGLAIHITRRISEVLENYDNVIVIEDDVSVSKYGLLSLKTALEEELPSDVLTIGLFGSLPGNSIERIFKNNWRDSIYFSAWGWAIQREKWNLYSLNIVSNCGIESLVESSSWQSLSNSQRRRWERRFSKVLWDPRSTWDFQMQFLTFSKDFIHCLPIWRMCDNNGFADGRATNTKNPKPRWYVGSKSEIEGNMSVATRSRIINTFCQFIDSWTWIGDRKIPRR